MDERFFAGLGRADVRVYLPAMSRRARCELIHWMTYFLCAVVT